MATRAKILKKTPLPENQNKTVKVYFGVFFDGTCNHRGQVAIGKRYRAKTAGKDLSKTELKKIKEEEGYNDLISQNNDRTNVDLLQEYHFNKKESDCFYTSIYIEGVGTYEDTTKGHSTLNLGAGTGKGNTGVLEKVKSAIKKINDLLNILKPVKGSNKVNLYFNVFGFSRGATSARNFVWEIVREQSPAIQDFKKNRNIQTVEVNFVGLFDTVSSFGYKMLYNKEKSDVRELNLDAVKYVKKKALHICAADEFRENFALTNIKSACDTGKGIEITIPGEHCDIGGSWLTGKYTVKLQTAEIIIRPEMYGLSQTITLPYYINYIRGENNNLIELDRKGPNLISSDSKLVELNDTSLKELGWIAENAVNEKQLAKGITIKESIPSFYSNELIVSFSNYIKRGYGFLGLYLMVTGSENNAADIFEKTKISKEIALPNDQIITKLKNIGDTCIKNNQSKDIFKDISNVEYKILRKNHLHFSSTKSLVNSPRYDHSVLKRAIIDG